MKINKKISIYILTYNLLIIVVFSLMYNKTFSLFFIKDINWKGGNEFLSLQNNFLWLWLPLNVFLLVFIVANIVIKLWGKWVWTFFFVINVSLIFITGIFLPYIFVMFSPQLSWFTFATILAISLGSWFYQQFLISFKSNRN